jgi:hypothetical protein
MRCEASSTGLRSCNEWVMQAVYGIGFNRACEQLAGQKKRTLGF